MSTASGQDGAPVTIVTGAARGIGLACARRLLASGHRVTAIDLDFSNHPFVGDRNVQLLGGDLTDHGFLNQVPHAVHEAWGRPANGLVNNAAISRSQDFSAVTLDEWNATIAVNLTAPMLLSQLFARSLVARDLTGRIVNITSIDANAAEPRTAAYTSTKAALAGLSRAMAVDLARYGISVNSVAPGAISTDHATALNGGPSFMRALALRVPSGRPGTVDEVAAVVAFLLRDAPEYLTGSSLTVDGGATTSLLWEV
jgi:NAD(P)-dependent dehydrogenase (short-subunit alcohol dehydrogenase family)